MKKIYKRLTKDQRAAGVIFCSTLSKYKFETTEDTTHEVKTTDKDQEQKIERLTNDSFFNNSSFNFNIIRE